jgi:hypothetical protein
MRITAKSTRLQAELQRRVASFPAGTTLAAKIVVPPEMIWWYWQEFGTALYAERGTLPGNEAGYHIPSPDNLDAHILVFQGRDGQTVHVKHAFTYGIPAKHMVTTVLGDIRAEVARLLSTAIGTYDITALHAALLEKVMPRVKEIIRGSFEANLSNFNRENGRLEATPADEFEAKATIEDVST